MKAAAGRIYVWRYPNAGRRGGYAGWHLTADGPGCEQLLASIDVLAAGAGRTKPLPVAIATAEILSVPNANHRAQAVRTLQLLRSEEPRTFVIDEDDGALAITLGDERSAELRQHVVDIGHGHGDVAMSADGKRRPPDQSLWFWWMPGSDRGDAPRRR